MLGYDAAGVDRKRDAGLGDIINLVQNPVVANGIEEDGVAVENIVDRLYGHDARGIADERTDNALRDGRS